MRDAEQVTFGGSTLDRARASELRGDSAAIAALAKAPEARAIALWRGKPLLAAPARDTLLRLPMDHPALAEAGPPLFLGHAPEPLFALDLSAWTPDDLDEATLGAFADPSEQWHPALGEAGVFAELRRVMAALSARDAELAASAKAVLDWHRSHRFCARCGAESDWALAGWQRLCPACGAHHFPRTDPVVIMLVVDGNDVLIGRSPGWPERMYSLLAGFIEPGETMEAAVRREVVEEAGVRVGRVDYLASQPWPFPASLMLGCIGRAESREITLDPVELQDALWVSRERLMGVFAGRDPEIRPPRHGAIAGFLLRNWLADRLD